MSNVQFQNLGQLCLLELCFKYESCKFWCKNRKREIQLTRGKNNVEQGSRKEIELARGKNNVGQGSRKKIELTKGNDYVGQGSQ